MREIKFRAWVKGFLPEQSGMYWQVELLRPLADGTYDRIKAYRNISKIYETYTFKSEEESFVLMQYTGLKDKNGVEIYEGDIVQDESGAMAQIIYSESCGILGGFTYGYRTGIDGLFDWEDEQGNRQMLCEVIGNIWENPELLESK